MTFTQYLMPDGRKREVVTKCTPDVEVKAAKVKALGGKFEVEILSTGEISMTVERDDAEGETQVLAHEICENGPAVPIAVARLVESAYTVVNHLGGVE